MCRALLAAAGTLFTACSSGAITHPAQPPPAAVFGANVRIGHPRGDDWEPYILADRFGHLFATITNISGHHLQFQRSDDGGETWSSPRTIDPSRVNVGQYDPWMALDPNDERTLLLTYMPDAPAPEIDLVRSTDLGATWSKPVAVSGAYHGLDKDAMAARGKTIAVCFDDFFTTYGAVSTDGGATWTQHPLETFKRAPYQVLCSGAGIDSRGHMFFSWDVSNQHSTPAKPAAEVWIERSSDNGATWHKTHVDYGGAGYPCPSCHSSLVGAFYGSQISLAVDSAGTVFVLWNATPAIQDRAPQRIYFARSLDSGATFSPRADVSLAPDGVEHSFPTVITGNVPGDVRIAWEDRRTGHWQLYYRRSADGGNTWSGESVLSNYTAGYSYLTPDGYVFPYGDYVRIALDPAGKLHAAWGESPAYTQPGNVWVANQR